MKKHKYGFFRAIFDITLTLLTGGLWMVYVMFRYLRTH